MATTALDADIPEQPNGIDVPALRGVMEEIRREPAKAEVEFRVRSRWQGQTRSETVMEDYRIGGREIAWSFLLCPLSGPYPRRSPRRVSTTCSLGTKMQASAAPAACRGLQAWGQGARGLDACTPHAPAA
jgi:hypothetical protein